MFSTSGFRPVLTKYYQSAKKLTTVTQTEGIKRIKLNNPKKRNALSLEMLKSLKKNLTDNINDSSLRCIVICGEGPVFSSGHDLKELTNSTSSKCQEIFSTCSDVMTTIRKLPIPVIAEVKGVASAAGFQLVASCDIVIATEKATFSLPGANVGIFCSTPGIAVARVLPPKLTSYLLLTGLPLTALEACQWGLISKVVPEMSLEEEIARITNAIASKSRSVIEIGKGFYYKQIEMSIQDAYREGETVMLENIKLMESREGIKAFLEKRHPIWKHSHAKIDDGISEDLQTQLK